MIDKLLTTADIQTLFSRSRTSLWRDIRENRFPKPIKLGGTSRWSRAAIETFIANGGNVDA